VRKIFPGINLISFWPLHIFGWLAFMIVHYLQMNLAMAPGQFQWPHLVVFYLSFLLFLTIQRYFFLRLPYREYSVLKLILLITVTALFLSTVRSVSAGYCIALLKGTALGYFQSIKYATMFQSIFTNSMIFIGWSGLYFGIKFLIEWNEQKEQTQKAYTLAQKAQLQMLRYQINPHFLFNSLNSIRALISENKVNAKGMITELAEFLRYSLLSENYMEVPLNQEIAAIHHYYAIEKRRYESKLNIDFAIDPRANDFPIISFLIHPLVENAIKYGMRTSSMPLKIQVRVDLHSDRLSVSVRNSGHWIEPPPETQPSEDSTGTGLQNVRHRLESAYPDRHTFIIDKKDDSVCICFEIFQRGKTDEEPL
jgi:hypothetical protein